MTAEQYREWLTEQSRIHGRKGGKSRSPRKLKALAKVRRAPRPGRAEFFRCVREVAEHPQKFSSIEAVQSLSTATYTINPRRASKIMAAAAKRTIP